MVVLKNKVASVYNVLLGFLLSLAGFGISCIPMRTEYGSPHADFKVNGKVESAQTNEAVEGIQVTMKAEYNVTDSTTATYGIDSILTQSNGFYQVIDRGGFPVDSKYKISVEDIDGSLNGSYENLDTIVEFIDPQFWGGDGDWDAGETTKEFNIKLKPKE